MGVWRHRLSNHDYEKQTALCSYCGQVPITVTRGVWRCIASRRQHHDSRNSYRGPYVKLKKKCEICRGGPTVLDHNHVTGAYRGSLCSKCNAALGMFKDDCRLMEKAIVYLKRSPII